MTSDPYVETLEAMKAEARDKRTTEIGLARGALTVRWNTELRPNEYRFDWHSGDLVPARIIVAAGGTLTIKVNADGGGASQLLGVEVSEADALALIRGETPPAVAEAFDASAAFHARMAEVRAENRAAWEKKWIGPRGRLRRTVDVIAHEVEFAKIQPNTI